MPLDIQRLRRSKAWLKAKRNPALGFYMINLWTASWHEVPAASLENDDEVLADLAVCDPDVWEQVKADVMRGWIKCSDGRLYHPVVAEKARESWDSKVAYRDRMKAARDAKAAKKSPKTGSGIDSMTGTDTDSNTDSDTGSMIDSVIEQSTGLKGEGQGQGQGEGEREGQGEVKTTEANASVVSGAPAPSADLLGDAEQTDEKVSEVVPACPVQQIVDLYHQCLPANPRVRMMDDARAKAIRQRWKQAAQLKGVKPFGYTTGAQGLKAWRTFFEVCAESNFLTGKSEPLPGKKPFVADIDFFMSPSGFKKCLENKYH